MLAVAAGKPSWPSFRDGWRIMQIVDACVASARDRRWVTVG